MGTMQGTEVVRFSGKIVARSKAAVLFAIFPADLNPSHEEFDQMIKDKSADITVEWFPLSQSKAISATFSVVSNALDTITVTYWIAKQKGLA